MTPLRVIDTGTTPAYPIPAGMEVCHFPALIRSPLEIRRSDVEALLARPHQILFYSCFAIEVVSNAQLISNPGDHNYWAVGSRSAEAIEVHFGVVPGSPEIEDFEHLKEMVLASGIKRPILSLGLLGQYRPLDDVAAALGVSWNDFSVYESRASDQEKCRELLKHFDPHWITFTSSRGARAFVDALGAEVLREKLQRKELRLAAIGPSTAATLVQADLEPTLVATIPDRRLLLAEISRIHSNY